MHRILHFCYVIYVISVVFYVYVSVSYIIPVICWIFILFIKSKYYHTKWDTLNSYYLYNLLSKYTLKMKCHKLRYNKTSFNQISRVTIASQPFNVSKMQFSQYHFLHLQSRFLRNNVSTLLLHDDSSCCFFTCFLNDTRNIVGSFEENMLCNHYYGIISNVYLPVVTPRVFHIKTLPFLMNKID